MMTHIRTLTPNELPDYRAQLLRLDPEDRRLRFGYPVHDDAIRSLVGRFQPDGDRVLAVFDDDLRIMASVHISFGDRKVAEFAFTVDRAARRAGLGRALFDRAVLWARNRGFREAHVFFLADNQVMRRMARARGMTVTIENGDCAGVLALPRSTPLSMTRETCLEVLASVDYASKARLRAKGAWARPQTA